MKYNIHIHYAKHKDNRLMKKQLRYNAFTLANYKNVVIQLTSMGYDSFIPFVITTQDFLGHEKLGIFSYFFLIL